MNKKLFLAIILLHALPTLSQIHNNSKFQKKFCEIARLSYTFPPIVAFTITNCIRQNNASTNLLLPKQVKVLTLINFFIDTFPAKNYILSKKKQWAKNKRIKIWVSATLSSVLTIIFIISYKKKLILKRRKEQTALQKENILKLKVIELQEEKEISKYYKRCLDELKIAFIKKTKQVVDLKRQMNKLGVQEELAQLRASVILTHKDWLAFKQLFDRSYPNFTKQLRAKNQYLTAAEIRFMMLKKINISNQDMAKTLGIGNNAIHKTNSRIRQKLHCTNEELNTLIKIL
jgi:DNA-binding CsgD family transcriptional regulator